MPFINGLQSEVSPLLLLREYPIPNSLSIQFYVRCTTDSEYRAAVTGLVVFDDAWDDTLDDALDTWDDALDALYLDGTDTLDVLILLYFGWEFWLIFYLS